MVRSSARLVVVVMAALLVIGCGDSSKAPESPSTPAFPTGSTEEGHSHGEGPSGGVVADWGGGEYHVEFTVNHDMQESTVYILDENARNPVPIKAAKLLLSIAAPAFQVDLLPVPLEGEPQGASSRFVGKDERLGVVQEFAGTISGESNGTPYVGDFKE